ncbi:MAG: hypothetical protein LBI93_01290 [Endomicrobium sp.]|jgi:putative addiction module killer protein|nr:hypothetical protein [Endomicrobium sp.]
MESDGKEKIMITVKFLPIFKKWFEKQTKEARREIIDAVNKISQGNTSSLKALRAGITEIKIHFGAGIRIYLVKENDCFYLILWGGADKKSQREDIEKAIKIKRFMEANKK